MEEIQSDIRGKKDYSITMMQANQYALPLMAGLIVLLTGPFLVIWGWRAFTEGLSDFFRWTFFPVLIVGIIVHELIHGLTWMIAGRKSWRTIKFGFQAATFTPYAHCKVPLQANAYRTGAAMPGLLLGVLPTVVATITGNGWLLCFGVFFTITAAGDMLILWLIRHVPTHALVEDHPTNAGCYVYE